MPAYREFGEFLERTAGIHLGDSKRYLVKSRLGSVLRAHGLDSLDALVRNLRGRPPDRLAREVVDAMTTNETQWFRDAHPFDLFARRILPELGGQGRQPLRVWSAACSSGQEVYSIAMVVEEYRIGNPGRLTREVEVLGTDISPTVLAVAENGIYDEMSLARGLSAERRRRHFVPTQGGWQVKEPLRRRASFRELNLLQGYATLGRFEVIFCRNVLIYFSRERKLDIIQRMAATLRPGGFLVLGASEAMPLGVDRFAMLRDDAGVMYRLR